MKQFLILCINGALIAVLGLIDSAFGNNMGTDAIIVLASWGTTYYLFNKIAMLGECCYQCDTEKFTESFIINLITSVLAGILMISTSNFTASLFDITEKQYNLLRICNIIYGLGIPISQIESIFNKYLVYNNKNKELIGATFVFYILMISWDAVVLILKVDCYWLIVGTVICNLVTDLYYLLICKVYKGFKYPQCNHLKEILSKGFFLWIERIFNAIAYMLGTIIASYMGEFEYAIHSVCIGIAGCTEDITNQWCQNQIVKLQTVETKNKYKIFKKEMKKTFFPAVIISFILSLALFFPMKGELPANITFKFLILYLSQVILLCPYENYRGLATSLGYTKCMLFNGIIGNIIRLIWAIICIITPIGLYGFAFMIGICFSIRGAMYAITIQKRYKGMFINE